MLMELTGQGQQLCLHALTPGRSFDSCHEAHDAACPLVAIGCHWLLLSALACFPHSELVDVVLLQGVLCGLCVCAKTTDTGWFVFDKAMACVLVVNGV